MSLFALKPTRTQFTDKPVELISDLDKIITKTYLFIFEGKEYSINPVSLEDFARYSQALANISNIQSKKEVSQKEVIEAYAEFISSVCPEVTVSMIERMTLPQLGALTNLVVSVITGTVEKKNIELTPTNQVK